MKFGFDIDDTLIDLRRHAFHMYNQVLGQKVGSELFDELPTLEIHQPFGLTDEEGNRMWGKLREDIYFTACPPFPDAVEVLNELVDQGHEVFYVTSRPAVYCERTVEWLKKNGFPVREGHFYCGMEDSQKVDIIARLGLDFYFDDKPAVLTTLSALKLKVYVKDTSYNRHLELPRITSWQELSEIVGVTDKA